jgi:hypothetical protein
MMVVKLVKETTVQEIDMMVLQTLLKHFLSVRRLYSWKNFLEKIDLRQEIFAMSVSENCPKGTLQMIRKQIQI